MLKLIPDEAQIAAQWREAIDDWRDGDVSTLDLVLRRSSMDIPDFARAFLADVAAGIEKRPKGRPKVPRYQPPSAFAHGLRVRMDYERFYCIFLMQKKSGFAERGAGGAKDRALEAVAKKWRYKLTPSAVSRIVHPRTGRKKRD